MLGHPGTLASPTPPPWSLPHRAAAFRRRMRAPASCCESGSVPDLPNYPFGPAKRPTDRSRAMSLPRRESALHHRTCEQRNPFDSGIRVPEIDQYHRNNHQRLHINHPTDHRRRLAQPCQPLHPRTLPFAVFPSFRHHPAMLHQPNFVIFSSPFPPCQQSTRTLDCSTKH